MLPAVSHLYQKTTVFEYDLIICTRKFRNFEYQKLPKSNRYPFSQRGDSHDRCGDAESSDVEYWYLSRLLVDDRRDGPITKTPLLHQPWL